MSNITAKKIDFLNIDSDNTYFDTKRQVIKRETHYFQDVSIASLLSGSNTAIGLLQNNRPRIKNQQNFNTYPDSISNSSSYPTGSTIKDSSGSDRKILSAANDYLVSSSVDAYRQGTEITEEKHWTAGVAKISAGTPGHLFDESRYGVPRFPILSADKFYEIETFNPVKFVETGGDYRQFTYPIVSSDRNLEENFILDGIIEPFPIRQVISNFSINFPFEPRELKASMESGNQNKTFSSDLVVSHGYFLPTSENRTWYLDSSDLISLDSQITGSLKTRIDHFNLDKNYQTPFVDFIPPRGNTPGLLLTGDLLSAVNAMPPRETSYLNEKQISFSCGFTYDNNELGTDSIAYGGLLY
jgi:hypothetical protein